jgi:site-specific DNA-methyltransferase (adenine-specific)
MTSTVTMHIGDVRDVMARLPDNYADLLVTSPPFLALRSYLPADHPDKHREIGSEPTPAAFLDTLYGLTADWGRLIPEWGSICVELGDTMSGSGGAGGDYNTDGLREGQAKFDGSMARTRAPSVSPNAGPGWPLAKSMCLMPHAYTIGLAYGHNPLTGQPHDAGQWRIRNVITWARPNPPVGSLGKRNPDRRTGDYKFRPACSFITVACRGTGRYFDLDAVRTAELTGHTPVKPGSDTRSGRTGSGDGDNNGGRGRYTSNHPSGGAPPLDWHTDDLDGDWLWKLATAPYPGSHYATYPLALPRRLVLAMCPQSVCTVCGWPRERVTAQSPEYAAARASVGDFKSERDSSSGLNGTTQYVNGKHMDRADNVTLGFTDCGHDAYRPGHVLDPFGGSGTTAVAAALEGRDATLIDLDRRNVDLVRRRLAENVRIISEVHDGDTVTWTVEQVTRSELVADAGGQMDLFAS